MFPDVSSFNTILNIHNNISIKLKSIDSIALNQGLRTGTHKHRVSAICMHFVNIPLQNRLH